MLRPWENWEHKCCSGIQIKKKKNLIRVTIKLLSIQDISFFALIFISHLIFVVPPTKPHMDVKLLKVPHC